MRHTTEVDCGALLALVRYFLDMDGAELILEALGLARGQLATRLDHVYANSVMSPLDDVNDAQEFTFKVRTCQHIASLVISSPRQLIHRDVYGQEVKLVQQARIYVLLHLAASELVLLVGHDPDGCLGAKLDLCVLLVQHEETFLHVVQQVEIIDFEDLQVLFGACAVRDHHRHGEKHRDRYEDQANGLPHIVTIKVMTVD